MLPSYSSPLRMAFRIAGAILICAWGFSIGACSGGGDSSGLPCFGGCGDCGDDNNNNNLTLPQFYSISVAPTTTSVQQGQSVHVTVTANLNQGGTIPTSIQIGALPTGVTAVSAAPVGPTNQKLTFDVTLTAAANAPATSTAALVLVNGTPAAIAPGSFRLSVVTGGGPDFSVTASPNPLTVQQGGSTPCSVVMSGFNGFTGLGTLTVTGLPTGVTSSVIPGPFSNGTTVTFTAAAGAPVTTASVPVTVTVTSGSLSHSVIVQLNVSPASTGSGDFTIHDVQGYVYLSPGTSQTNNVDITPINGFTGSVTFSITGLPTGVTASFAPNPATTSTIMTLTAAPGAPVTSGPTILQVTGTSGSLVHTSPVDVGVI